MKIPLSVKIGTNFIFTSFMSILPTSLLINYIFKKKNPKNKTLTNTNRIMFGIHLLSSIIMYYRTPLPPKNTLIAFKDIKKKKNI